MAKMTIIARQSARTFEITCALQEGYSGGGFVYGLDVAILTHADWQTQHGILGGTIEPVTIVYGMPSVLGGQPIVHSHAEPGFVFRGAVNPLYESDMADNVMLNSLVSLAGAFAERLKQQRVYLTYRDQAMVLEVSG